MASRISLTADKKSVKKGDSVTVSWTSGLPDSLVLTIDDGDSVQHIQVADSGSRICWTNRARKNMVFTLEAITGGRKETTRAKVRVQGAGRRSRPAASVGISKFQLWKERMQAGFSVARAQFHYVWTSLKTWQKVLYATAFILPWVILLIVIF
ncbi:MAG: hypothetical protein ACI39U_01990 [Candidatus Cryptobacteroides sp.]